MPAPFAHLRVHSDYSLGRGASKVKALVKRASYLGQPAMALVDDLNLHGAMKFADTAFEAGVQPIMGATVHLPVGKGNQRGSLILLAQSDTGYANICRLVNLALNPKRTVPGVLDKVVLNDLFREQAEGQDPTADIIALAGCGADSIVGQIAASLDASKAAEVMTMLQHLFPGRYYVEVCRNGFPEDAEIEIERLTLELAHSMDLPIVATTDIWYATDAEHDAYEILKAVAQNEPGAISAEEGSVLHASPRRYGLRSGEEMQALFADLPEAFAQTLCIARRCGFAAHGRKPILPPFVTHRGLTEAEEMRVQAKEGLQIRLDTLGLPDDQRQAYWDRLEFELGVIEKMQFPGYFLIVSDFIKWAKSKDIPVGPGRGSGAGSVVAWALFITDLDPLRFNLLFERFLNPDRVSMPDFDVDFCQDRRQEVINYVKDKYGIERVAQIATFTELKSKGALSDAGRVVRHVADGSLNFKEIKGISALIPPDKDKPADPAKLAVAYETSGEFRARIDETPRATVVFENAKKIEGLYRNASSHAAGIIIGGDTLTKLVPVGFDPKSGFPVVQFNMKDAENAGLVKFDFLGLKNLSVIKEAIANIRETTGKEIDIMQVPLDDKATFDMLSEGLGTSVFQLESEGMKKVLKNLKPSVFEDLIAVVSLYRPGPMDLIPTYVDCKHGRKEPDFPEPRDRTEPILKETFGIMVYQEQVMQIAQAVAGFSLGQADLLRRAMGKKDAALLAAQKKGFVDGAVSTGVQAKHAESLFDNIEKFASYGFNKSHAAAYALIAYHTAWLKRHYPCEFFSAILSYETSAATMALVKQDLDHFGIPMLPACINGSQGRFKPERTPEGKLGVRFGLTAINGISEMVEDMVKERKANGPYPDLETFFTRAGKCFNSGQFTSLAKAGAFDRISPNENRKLACDVLTFLAKNSKGTESADLFGGAAKIAVPKDILATADWPNKEDQEFEVIGFYVRQHPLDRDLKALVRRGVRRRASFLKYLQDHRLDQGSNKRILGLIEKVDVQQTRRGMSYLRVLFAEKEDKYWVSYYVPFDQNFDEMRGKLEIAKKGRTPIVFVARFGQSNRPDRQDNVYYADSHAFWTAEEFLRIEAVPGTLLVEIDPRRVNRDHRNGNSLDHLAAADQQMADNPGEESATGVTAALCDVAQFVINDVKDHVLNCPRDDATGYEVHFVLRVTGTGGPTQKFIIKGEVPGRYAISAEVHKFILATGGVVAADFDED